MRYIAFVRGNTLFRYEEQREDPDNFKLASFPVDPPQEEELLKDFYELMNPSIYIVPPNNVIVGEYCYVIYKVSISDEAQSGSESVDKMWLLGAQFSKHRFEFIFSKKANYLCNLPQGGKEFIYSNWNEKVYEVFMKAILAYRGGLKGVLTRHWIDRALSLYSDFVELGYDSQSIFNRCMDEMDDVMYYTNIKPDGDYFALLTVLLEYFQTSNGAESIDETSKERLVLLQAKQMLICGIEQIKEDMPRTLCSLFFDSEKSIRLNEMVCATMRARDLETLGAIYENVLQNEKDEPGYHRYASSL